MTPEWKFTEKEIITFLHQMKVKYPIRVGYEVEKELCEAQAKKLVEWIEQHSQLERCDPDVMAYFNDYRWIDEAKWQQLKKEVGLE